MRRGVIREYIREEKPATSFELAEDHVSQTPDVDESVVPPSANVFWELDNDAPRAEPAEPEEPEPEPEAPEAPEAPEPAEVLEPTPEPEAAAGTSGAETESAACAAGDADRDEGDRADHADPLHRAGVRRRHERCRPRPRRLPMRNLSRMTR